MSWQRILTLLMLVGGACGDSKTKALRNHCASDDDCETEARCDAARSQCIATKSQTPYPLVLQVTTSAPEPGQIARHTFPVFDFGATDRSKALSIPTGLSLNGIVSSVRGDRAPDAVRAQIVFRPESARGLPVVSVTAGSRDRFADDRNFSVTLTPNTTYGVTVYPLGAFSSLLPPLYRQLDTNSMIQATSLELEYNATNLESFTGVLRDEQDVPLTGHWVRIVEIDGDTRTVMSSIGVVGQEGELDLVVHAGVLARQAYVFEIDLDNENAWSTVIEADWTHVAASKGGMLISIPEIPRFVRFQGAVDKSPNTDLTFVSDFRIPDVLGDVGDRDFCRSSLPSEAKHGFKCRSTRKGTTDSLGRFSVKLLPGDYQVFLSPTQNIEDLDRATTKATTAEIETQSGDQPQQGQTYMLDQGSVYGAGVRTFELEPLEDVLVRAVALGLLGSLGEVATYNRSSEAVTNGRGRFELAVDFGYYDFVARPNASVGFPWAYVANVPIQVDMPGQSFEVGGFLLRTPLLLAGTLKRNGQAQPGASVDAYALVQGIDQGKRAVLIGQSTTDAEGNYNLLLPDTVESREAPPQPPALDSE